MSVWVLQTSLPQVQQERQTIKSLPLPFDEPMDLRAINGQGHAIQIMRKRYPDTPPETLMRRFERMWHAYTQLQDGDTVAVLSGEEVSIFEVMGHYYFDEKEESPHHVPVKWQCDTPLQKFKKHQTLFDTPKPLTEITYKEDKVAILQKLPHKYNRFVKWQWLAYLMIGMGLFRLMGRMGI